MHLKIEVYISGSISPPRKLLANLWCLRQAMASLRPRNRAVNTSSLQSTDMYERESPVAHCHIRRADAGRL